MVKLDPSDDLVVCSEHCIKKSREGLCPACETGVSVRHDEHPGNRLTEVEFRNRITHETMVRLLRLMQPYLRDKDMGPLWLTVMGWPEDEQLPAGYTPPERYQNILVYDWGTYRKAVIMQPNAKKTINNLEEKGYTPEP